MKTKTKKIKPTTITASDSVEPLSETHNAPTNNGCIIAVENDIPLPPTRTGKYPFRTMGVGQSFAATSKYVAQSAYLAGKKLGFKFTCRATDGTFRVWRTA